MKKQNQPKDVLLHLATLNEDKDKDHSPEVQEAVTEQRTKKKLVFGPTGELEVVETVPDDAVIIDQIYKDGFFCKLAA